MALSLLLDEHISPVVAEQMATKRPDIRIQSIHTWREGAFLSVSDEAILAAAYEDGLTLLTYDTQILSELDFLFEQDVAFSGLIFVDEATLPRRDFGGLIRAISALWDKQHTTDWNQRLLFLAAAPNEP